MEQGWQNHTGQLPDAVPGLQSEKGSAVEVANDMAVLAAYGIKKGDPAYASESACVAFLMKKYQELTEK